MSIQQTADALLRNATADGAVPGVVAGATNRDGNLYLGGFGERVLGGGEEMTPDTVGWLASMTKALTGAAAMQLVERGRLDLDTPAAQVVPALGDARVLEGFEEDGKPRTRAPSRAITLRHLLTHTAGFSYEIWNASIIRYQTATGTPGIISCQDAALGTPLLFDPGDRWEYGINMEWVGKMIEAVSGQRLGEYFRDHLLEPLGMRDTAFRITDAMRARLAKIHQRAEDGSLIPQMDFELPQDPEVELGGAGLYGTIGDYLCFIRMMLNRGRVDGEQILAPETVDAMCSNQMGACRVGAAQDRCPAVFERRGVLPRHAEDLGLQLHDQHRGYVNRPLGGESRLGRPRQFLLLDRSDEGRRRRLPDASPAVRRREVPAPLLGF